MWPPRLPAAGGTPAPQIVSLSWRSCGLTIAILTVLASQQLIRASDGLADLRREARAKGPFDLPQPREANTCDEPKDPYRDESQTLYDDEENSFEEFIGGAVLYTAVAVASAPFLIPAKVIGDDFESPAFFPRYPYQEPVDGYLMIHPDIPRKPRQWSGRVQGERSGNLDDITGWNGGLLVETTSRFGLDTWVRYYEQDLAAGGNDELLTGDTNLLFRFAQATNIEMRTGVGFNWLSDQLGDEFGFNFTYGADWYPIRPLIVSSEIDWGEVGHASLFHGRITVGVEYHRAELYVGYDYLDVGNAQLDSWITGLRVWF